MAEFKLPPISPLAGSSFRNYIKALKGNKIDRKFIVQTIVTGLVILVGSPFRWFESLTLNRKAKKHDISESPLFILGHWRSGTTFLHNVLCQAPNAGYISTYQALFPNNLSSKWLFRSFMSAAMPKKRPSDNVPLAVHYPQEDEFALGNLNPFCYYYFFYFPHKYQDFYQKYVRYENVSEKVKQTWQRDYTMLIKKALLNTKGEQAMLKNPVNTARIAPLLEIFPKAKFIHIYRNPVVVYLSIKKFFIKLMPTLYFQKIEEKDMLEIIFDIYNKLMQDYFDTKKAIPKESLVEIKFEDFEKTPLKDLENIYKKLHLKDFDKAKTHFEKYLDSQKSYKKNIYKITKGELDKVKEKWGFTMNLWNYDIPENLEIVKE